ncbi:MAG: hypothetical protein WA830_05235 [Candidatus Sulfotelmatobacter sp.]
MIIQATAMGTSTQLGKMVNVNIHIDEFSTQDDRKGLIDAFKRSGQDGIVAALDRMKGKGRFSTPYGVGNEVKYIFELPPDKGRRHIRLITDRRIAFGEAYANTRSKEYSVGAVDLFLTPDGKGSEGTALPACKLKVSKKTQQVEVETYQNRWKLTNLIISKK